MLENSIQMIAAGVRGQGSGLSSLVVNLLFERHGIHVHWFTPPVSAGVGGRKAGKGGSQKTETQVRSSTWRNPTV